MNNTLKMCNQFVKKELLELSLNELACMYQDTPYSSILATAYNKVFKLAVQIKNHYWGIDEAEIASICMERLDYALKTYNTQYQFTTYFAKVFSNALRTKTEALNAKKRKAIIESIDEIIDVGIEDTYDLLDMILPKSLTDKEFSYCKLVSEGLSNSDIAQYLDVSVMTLCNYRKSIRNKCDLYKTFGFTI